ncbi:hypothetical protein BDY21DRAFT_342924 [Lineolata rhizophorae]|uniref:Cyclin-D1-binding protein 1-like N-terminal domain-containing protein n=1 Tax=Lineolata rhizophorae TaxID=578093 RepID=A0A6A6P302_9PEZI|nr:hypothetical protein BDY21DRAFT_342924 [Lineolata rhizophorae]
MAAFTPNQSDIRSLIALTKSIQTLTSQYFAALTSAAPTPSLAQTSSWSAASSSATSSRAVTSQTSPQEAPPLLPILRDAASLLKAHTTRLSLLLINNPYTPSAISSVLRDIANTALPTMIGAVDLAGGISRSPDPKTREEASRTAPVGSNQPTAEPIPRVLLLEVRARVRRVLREVDALLADVINGAEQELSRAWDNTTKSNASSACTEALNISTGAEAAIRDCLASTGVLWEACDALVELEKVGLVGLVVKRAEEWRELIKDAAVELKEWADDVEEEEDEGIVADDFGSNAEGVDEIFDTPNKFPRNDHQLRMQLERSIKKIKMVGMLYEALTKRRLMSFPPSAQHPSAQGESHRCLRTLDALMDILKALPDTVDELAGAFYELDRERAELMLSKCCDDARGAADLVRTSWRGDEDQFTAWSRMWNNALQA